MDNLQQVVVVAGINLDKHIHAACRIMTFHYLRNLLQLVYNVVELLWILKIQTYISTCLITYLLGIDDELRALDDAKICQLGHSLMDGSTAHIACSCHFKEWLTAKGHGKDALGQVDIVANYNGRRFHGVGLATDIVESSAKAMVHVLNNIWRAAEVEKELQRKAQHNENNKETV